MYLQITTKCHAGCAHCCYSCNKNGKHMAYDTFEWALDAAAEFGDEAITIGGGEPTLHPRFFDILRACLENFDYVWMATNGSQTRVMRRLADILDGNDFENMVCTCASEEEREDCQCYRDEDGGEIISQEDKLSVALSLDQWHPPIDQRIVDLWRKRAEFHGRHRGFEIRNVGASRNGPINVGRAKHTGVGSSDDCPCSDIMIKPSGAMRLCGCPESPIIGHVKDGGILEKWEKIISEDDGYRDTNCYKTIGRQDETSTD